MKLKTTLNIKSNIIEPAAFINVFFLLVVFFVLSSGFTGKKGIVMDLPQIEQSELYSLSSLEIILKDGRIILNEADIGIDKLQEEITLKNPQLLAIKADKNASYSKVAEIIAMAQHLGVKQIAMAADFK